MGPPTLPSEHAVDFMPSAGPQRSFGHSTLVDVVAVVAVVVALPEPVENDPVEPFPVFGAGAGAGAGSGSGPGDGAG